jgi:hypothetical protein
MEKDLRAYIKVYENHLSDEICKQTLDEIERIKFHQHTFYDPTNGSYATRSGNRELDVSWDTVSTRPIIMQRIWDGISQYLQELNFPWFGTWKGYSGVRFNQYKEDRLMAEHCDHIHSLFDGEIKGIPTISIVGTLNDDYEGGEFVMFQDEVIKMPKGCLLMFPSNFLYPHRVDPVTKGVRNTYVSWAY